jgi:hypothetical protein
VDGVLLLLLFALIWIAVAVGLAPLIGRTLSHKSRFDPQDRTQLGLLEHERAERRERVKRALERHETRKSA